MDEPVKSSIPDGTTATPSANTITPMGATYSLEQVKLLPELHLLTYAKIVEPIAIDVEVYTKIPRLVPIIQSAHESRFGNSGLARQYGNLFGIKATNGWIKAGNAVAPGQSTHEYKETTDPEKFRELHAKYDPILTETKKEKDQNGSAITIYVFRVKLPQDFRSYKSWRDSFFDWGRLMTELSVYKPALALLRNPASVPLGIKEMAKTYATDPQYANQLLAIYDQLTHGGQACPPS